MSKKVYKAREFEKVLKDNGWNVVRQSGDHKIWCKNGLHLSTTSTRINRMIAQRLIKTYGLEVY